MPAAGRSKLQSVTCALAVPVAALALAGCGGGGDEEASGAAATSPTASVETGECADVEAPAPRDGGGETAPSEPLDPSRTWTLTFETSCGTFVVTLDLDAAPHTAASLVSLARDGYFDDTVFHRIVPGFVIQGGDPTQSGSGGPGYSTVDPPPAGASYTKGVVAMAKTQAEPAGMSGSQFFVVTGDDVGLPPDYAVVGRVTDGLDVVEVIGALGDPATEEPLRPIVIDSVTVASS
jgi:peptidyl-prolyl cis-trans isomerase B (cyclophilin B)